jgi:hypothetical protein
MMVMNVRAPDAIFIDIHSKIVVFQFFYCSIIQSIAIGQIALQVNTSER